MQISFMSMDTRLLEAAETGNIILLHQLLKENPLILNTTSPYSIQNALYIASISGHLDFAKEILRLKPEFAYALDQDDFTPLHMAAAAGHVEIAREIIGIDQKLCRVEGIDKRTPLHVAAVKGKVGLIKEMVSSCVECIEDVNVQGETALHLAVKNNQFEAVRFMVELLREMKKEHVLNMKDEQGNTVLHLATWRKQRQVIELLLAEGTANSGQEVNAINKSGLTALDLLRIFPSEAGDREIYEILQNAGAKRGNDIITLSTIHSLESQTSTINTQEACPSQENNLVEYFKFKRGRDSPSEARSALLVVASLVATATFQAGLSPPGGTWQDNSFTTGKNNTTSDKNKHQAGRSIMGTFDGLSFTLFVLFNTIGFAVSLSMINILTSKFPLQFELQVCIIAMYFSYNTAMTTIAPAPVKLSCILITTIVSIATPYLTRLLERPTYQLAKIIKQIIHRIF